ncbi:hypothetical protein NBRC3293_2389 [Gluconobacter oxydans NBRC 3293]|uniref:Uncharacterized protein n=1 Tax=Gluconobacter oxydans NBRC 3293 TaxID=1315969 RepID=A0A829WXN3_GLUOY|nr:hypothetical protein NBRC3293_2389 [Gluconobacter oxydans NBRC 3293]
MTALFGRFCHLPLQCFGYPESEMKIFSCHAAHNATHFP